MVLGIGEETPDEVVLAILRIDPDTMESIGGGELTVAKDEFQNWEMLAL